MTRYKTSYQAVFSLVFGILGIGGFLPFSLLAVFLGYAALSRIKKDITLGGPAKAGIALGWIGVGVAFVLVAIFWAIWPR